MSNRTVSGVMSVINGVLVEKSEPAIELQQQSLHFSFARLLNRCQEGIALRDVMDECLITLREHPRDNLWGSTRLHARDRKLGRLPCILTTRDWLRNSRAEFNSSRKANFDSLRLTGKNTINDVRRNSLPRIKIRLQLCKFFVFP